MVCVYCGGTTDVVNSRHKIKSNEVWRRRACQSCQAVFSTLETVNLERSVSVKDSSGHLEPFERDKLYISIASACGHRKDASKAASALTATVIGQLLPQIIKATINKDLIIQTTSKILGRFDKAASVTYSAYHQR